MTRRSLNQAKDRSRRAVPHKKRKKGSPSKEQRRVTDSLANRVAGYKDVPATIRGGFRQPGSENRSKR